MVLDNRQQRWIVLTPRLSTSRTLWVICMFTVLSLWSLFLLFCFVHDSCTDFAVTGCVRIQNLHIINIIIIVVVIFIIKRCKWLQRLTNLTGNCLRMRPHFPSEEPRTASETGRWFLCCPLWWQWRVSRFLAPVQWLAGSMNLLSRWQLGKSCFFRVTVTHWYFAVN